MFYVYVLQSLKNYGFYIAFAPDLKARFLKHQNGLVRSTKNLLPLDLIYYEAYKSKQDALTREKRLKKFAKGFSSLKGRLKYSINYNATSLLKMHQG